MSEYHPRTPSCTSSWKGDVQWSHEPKALTHGTQFSNMQFGFVSSCPDDVDISAIVLDQ
uniref:Uncharacterized protein n=1 Tax=Arundo donax TaxID=35708 RepID=A0A0A9ECK5_ARUDO